MYVYDVGTLGSAHTFNPEVSENIWIKNVGNIPLKVDITTNNIQFTSEKHIGIGQTVSVNETIIVEQNGKRSRNFIRIKTNETAYNKIKFGEGTKHLAISTRLRSPPDNM